FLLYYNFLPIRESLRQQKNELEMINKIIKILNEFSIEDIKDEHFDARLDDFEFIGENIISEYVNRYNILQNDSKELDDLENIYSKIKESRDKLVDNIKRLKE